jgi:catechol 2,3-dioxygenase-like lactoylglutathione lyase family enzyme
MSLVPIRNNLVLELHIPDFQKARDFYKIFGFEELYYDPTSGGGSDLGYMVLIRRDLLGDTSFHFYGDKEKVTEHAGFNQFPANTPRGWAVEITVPVSDVEALWNEVSSKLPEDAISQPLITKRWGKKDFRVFDPFGFYVRFTELVDWGQEGKKS